MPRKTGTESHSTDCRWQSTDDNRSPRRLSADLVCRLLFVESSGRDLEPILRARGISLDAGEICQLEAWFPRREVILWAPDHF